MARLSTHVLDTANGIPAAGVRIELHRFDAGQRRHLKTVVTNRDGRTDAPLLTDSELSAGVYELTFHAADYFRSVSVALPSPPFFDQIVIRFGISELHALNSRRHCDTFDF